MISCRVSLPTRPWTRTYGGSWGRTSFFFWNRSGCFHGAFHLDSIRRNKLPGVASWRFGWNAIQVSFLIFSAQRVQLGHPPCITQEDHLFHKRTGRTWFCSLLPLTKTMVVVRTIKCNGDPGIPHGRSLKKETTNYLACWLVISGMCVFNLYLG